MRITKLSLFLCLFVFGCGQPEPPPASVEDEQPATVVDPGEPPDSDQLVTIVETPRAAVVSSPPVASSPRFQTVTDGLALFDDTLHVGDRVVGFHVVSVDINQRQAGIVADSAEKSPGRSVENFRRESKASVALSGGFLKSFFPALPLGYVQVSGEPVNRKHESDFLDGLLLLNDSRVDVLLLDEELESSDDLERIWRDVLQSGPVLVLNGQSRFSSPGAMPPASNRSDADLIEGPYERAFVGVGCEGKLLLGLSGMLTLQELSGVLALPLAQGGFACRAALNLSGAKTAGMVLDTGQGIESFGGVDYRIANAIIIR